MPYNRRNYIKRAQRVAELTYQHYECGRQDRSLAAVWRKHVFPIYPMTYQTFLRHLATARQGRHAKHNSQLTLF